MEIHFETEKTLKIVDCREMFPPEPMEKILEAVEVMGDDEAVLMVHRREPFPLFEKLRVRHLDYEIKRFEDGSVQILISKTQI